MGTASRNKHELEKKLAALMKDMNSNQVHKISIHTQDGVILVQPDEII